MPVCTTCGCDPCKCAPFAREQAIRAAYVKGKQEAVAMGNETCVDCGVKLPIAWALTTCERCPPLVRSTSRPTVHVGEVLGVLYNELTQLIREHGQLKGFEQRVVQAAKSPAAWLALREELGK